VALGFTDTLEPSAAIVVRVQRSDSWLLMPEGVSPRLQDQLRAAARSSA
jgi:hypothetical protein